MDTSLDCDDSNPCTSDTCDPDAGCQHPPNTAPCDNSDPCTSGDSCANGECVAGPAIVCSDNNPCTEDICEPGVGCVFVGADQEVCDGLDNDCDGKIDEDDACPPGTEVAGVLPCNTSWSVEESPYHVTGSLLVPSGCKMDIEAGTVIKFFVSEKGSDWDHRLYLQVDGALNAIGTSDSPIVFTADKLNPSKANWGGVYIKASSSTTSLRHVSFQYAGGKSIVGGEAALLIANGNFTIEDCVFNHTKDALRYLASGDLLVINSIFKNVQRGVFLIGAKGSITLKENMFQQAETPVYCPTAPNSQMTVENNLFTGGGMYRCDGSGHSTTISNNVFDGTGIWLLSGCAPTISANNFTVTPEFFVELWEFNQAPGNPSTISMEGNWWGDETTAEMVAKGPDADIAAIHDYYDDFTQAKVGYTGWLSEPVAEAGPQ